MASPVVEATNTSSTATASTSHTINMPAGVVTGDLLIVVFASVETGGTSMTGWTELMDASGSNAAALSIYYRVADETEGATETLTTATSREAYHCSYRISNYQGTPEVSTVASGTDTAPNASSLSPSWGLADALWITNCSSSDLNASNTVSAYPTNYTNGIGGQSSTDGATATLGSARRTTTASSENAGAFTTTGTPDFGWKAATIAVQGTSGDTFTLTAAVGSFVLTGLAALKLISRSTAVGTYLLTGQISNRAITRASALGTYILTGIAATMIRGVNFAAEVGTYVLTGIAAALNSVRSFVVDAGAYVLTGQAIVKMISRFHAAGSYALTGIANILARIRAAVFTAVKNQPLVQRRKTAAKLQKHRQTDAGLQKYRREPPRLG